MGLSVCLVRSPMEAVSIFRNALELGIPFDIVIISLSINGKVVADKVLIQLKKVDDDICAIVIGKTVEHPIMKGYRSYGFDAMATKPYSFKYFQDLVREVLERKTGTDFGLPGSHLPQNPVRYPSGRRRPHQSQLFPVHGMSAIQPWHTCRSSLGLRHNRQRRGNQALSRLSTIDGLTG